MAAKGQLRLIRPRGAVQGPDLFELLQQKKSFASCHVIAYARQLAAGLAFIHGKRIILRDLKLENILVDPVRKGRGGWIPYSGAHDRVL